MAVQTRRYPAANTGGGTHLARSFEREWQEPLNEPGEGSVSIQRSDADFGVVDYDDILRFRLNGTDVFVITVESIDNVTVAEGEEHDETCTYSGRGLLSLWETNVIYPELGINRLSPDYRAFNFASIDYDDSAWISATEIKEYDDDTFGQWETSVGQAPLDFPDLDAWWIWSRAQSTNDPPQPVGDSYFRFPFNLANEVTAAIFISADDGFELWLDGAMVAREVRAFMWGETKRVNLFLDAGDHLLAIKGTNIFRTNSSTNVAGVILSMVETDEGGTTLGSVILHTDSNWLALDYPVPPPNMTPGEILRVIREEAQARGWNAGMADSFTDTQDSDGNNWTDPVDVQFQVGTTALDAIRQLCETSIDVRMSATGLTLNAYNKGTLGTDLTGAVTLDGGVNLGSLTHDGDGPGPNTALIKSHTGVWVEIDDLGASTAHGRKECYASMGSAPSPAQAERSIQAFFAVESEPLDSVSAEPLRVTGVLPYADFGVGDTIDVMDAAGGLSDLRVLSMTVSEEDPASDGEIDGTQIFTITGQQGTPGGS